MTAIDEAQRDEFFRRIVKDFGNGTLRPDLYVHDQITRVPEGMSVGRIPAEDFLSLTSDAEFLVLLDPHPNNRRFAEEVANRFGDKGSLSFA